MLGFGLNLLVGALALLIVDIIFPGVTISSFVVAIIAGLVIGFVNSFIKPILFILSLPVTLLTLGLFTLVLNGLCFWLASVLVPGFAVHGFLAFIAGPIILSLATTFLNNYFAQKGIATSPLPIEAEQTAIAGKE
jgi:putative membrane protein